MREVTRVSIFAILACSLAFAQNSSISGTVSSQGGGTLANATVTLQNLTSGVKQQAITDSSGHYAFNGLQAGRYQLSTSTAQATGTPSQEITLADDQAKTIDITMQSAGTTTVATAAITDVTPTLDMTTPQTPTVYNTRYVQYNQNAAYLEPNGSAFGAYNLSLLSPNVFSNSGFGVANGPVVGGQRPWSNNFYIEGIDNNNRRFPGPQLYVPNEATTEMQSYQNVFPPDFGHTLGGQFNDIVRTGTNQFHGSAYWYSNNRNLNAIDQRFANAGYRDLPRYDQNRIGADFGLPVLSNHLFLYGDFEYIPLGFDAIPSTPIFAPTAAGYATLSGLSGISRTNLGILQTYAGTATTPTAFTTVGGVQIPIGMLRVGPRQYQNRYIGAGSADWNVSNTDQFRMRYFHNATHSNNNGAILPAFFEPESDRALLASVAEYHNFSSTTINELRLGYQRFDSIVHNNGLTYPGLSGFPNLFIQNDLNLQLGNGFLSGVPTFNQTYQASDTVNITRGRHVFKIGGEGRRFIGPIPSYAALANGYYSYSSLSSFLLDQNPTIGGIRSFGNLRIPANNWEVLAFINDSWRVSSNFTLNLGVKWNYVTLPRALQGLNSATIASGTTTTSSLVAGSSGSAQSQNTAFAPQIGIAWSPGFVKNTVFRAGFSMNYDTTYTAVFFPSIPPGAGTYLSSATGRGFLASGGLVNKGATNTVPSYFSDQRLPYTMQWNADIQQQVFHRMVLDIGYLGVKAIHLPAESYLNAISPVTAATNLPLFYTRPSQTTLNSLTTTLSGLQAAAAATTPISTMQPGGWSWYNALTAQLRQRFSGGFQMQLAYTYSHLFDNLSGPTYSALGFPTLTEQEIRPGTSVFDHRQRASATVLWDLSGVGGNRFNWVRDVLANMNLGLTYTYESPDRLLLNSGVNAGLTGFATSGVITNPSGIAGVGSGVTPLTNSAGQTVGYLVNNPNAQYIAAAPGIYTTSGGRTFLFTRPIQNFDASLFKRFAVRDRFSLEFFGQAYNLFNHPQFTTSPIHDIGSVSNAYAFQSLLVPGTPSFGAITSVLPSNARTLQVGARFLF